MSEFLAEARILVRPDTTKFRSELVAAVAAATKGVTAPIQVTPVVGSAAAATSALAAANQQAATATLGLASAVTVENQALARGAVLLERDAILATEDAAAQQAAGAAKTQSAVATRELAAAQALGVRTAQQLALSQTEVATAASAVGAAQTQAARAAAAVALAERAVGAALTQGNIALIDAASNSLVLARAREAETIAALNAARANAGYAASVRSVQTAGVASLASLTGLRGAVLTAGGAFIGATIAIQAFARAVQSAASLQTELNVFRVTASATADEMARVRAEAVALGRDVTLPGVAASDAAEAMLTLARAGLEVEDSLAGARGVLQLATAAQISNAEAAEIAANALNSFNLAGDETVQVADLLANAANESQASINEMGIALRQVAGAAAGIGLTVEDTVTLLTALSRAGLSGSDAGTTLRVALLRLVAPTKDAQQAIEKLNLDLRDAAGNVRPEVFFELEEALQGVSRAEADRIRVAIFGQNAFRVSTLLGRENVQTFRQLEESLNRQGAAADLAAARTQGFAGQMEALRSNLETLGTTLGSAVIPPLTLITDVLNEQVTAANTAAGAFGRLTGAVTSLGGAFVDAIPGGNRFLDLTERILGFTFGGPIPTIARGINLISDQFSESADEIRGNATDTERDVRALFETMQSAGGFTSPTALNQFVVSLDEMADRLQKGDAEAQRLARRIRDLIRELQNQRGIQFSIDFDFDESEARAKGEQAGNAVTAAIRGVMSPEAARALGATFMENVGRGATTAAPAAAEEAGQTFVLNLGARIEVAQAQGAGDTELLRLLRERQRRQQEFLNRQLALTQTPERQELVERAAQNLQATNDQIQQILDRQRADAENAAREREATLEDIQNSFLRGLTIRRAEAENRVAIAQSTRGIGDDIRAQDALTALIRRQIAAVRREITERQVERELVSQLTAALIQSRNAARRLREERRREAEEARQARLDQRQRALELNLEFAEITGNENAQERALRAIIVALEKRIRGMKGISNKERELRNELARRRKQLDELRGEQEENNRSAEQFFFEQLQAQQGFAANLLGNLITGPTAGLVGRPAATTGGTIQARISAEAAAAKGRQGGGPTSGQVNSTNELLLRILNQIKILTSTTEAPEAIEQRRTSGASLDYAVM